MRAELLKHVRQDITMTGIKNRSTLISSKHEEEKEKGGEGWLERTLSQ